MSTTRSLGKLAKLSWLDLRGTGFSVLERLCIEEALLRHDPIKRCWGIIGNHEPSHNRIVKFPETISSTENEHGDRNENCVIVLGIGGKPNELLNLELVREDGVMCIKRFSGGGTVVVDHSSILTTFIGRTDDLPDVKPFPRNIMKWSADVIFEPVFKSMNNDMMHEKKVQRGPNSLVMDTKSCGVEMTRAMRRFSGKKVEHIPDFMLRENDYVMGDRKMGGNAQSIVHGGWLHHTSFLWDYHDDNMRYLTLPKKRPDYRGERSHNDFLVKLKSYYGLHHSGKSALYEKIKEAATDSFDLEEVTIQEALAMIDAELGGMQNWFEGKCRTRLIEV